MQEVRMGGTVQNVYGGTVQKVCGGGTVQKVCGGTVQKVWMGGTVQEVCSGTVQEVCSGTVIACCKLDRSILKADTAVLIDRSGNVVKCYTGKEK